MVFAQQTAFQRLWLPRRLSRAYRPSSRPPPPSRRRCWGPARWLRPRALAALRPQREPHRVRPGAHRLPGEAGERPGRGAGRRGRRDPRPLLPLPAPFGADLPRGGAGPGGGDRGRRRAGPGKQGRRAGDSGQPRPVRLLSPLQVFLAALRAPRPALRYFSTESFLPLAHLRLADPSGCSYVAAMHRAVFADEPAEEESAAAPGGPELRAPPAAAPQ